MKIFRYLFLGILFGIILTKSEVVSWFRIQEMFRFQSFHMFGIIGSAIVTGAILIRFMKWKKMKTINKEAVIFPEKTFNQGYIYGGILFGLGWAMTGACPGPMFALAGAGIPAAFIMILSALAGTWVYSYFRDKLPH
jgi:uncharacterized protein